MSDNEEKHIERFVFDQTEVEVNHTDQVVKTTLPDGKELLSSPQDTPTYEKMAEELGYETTWDMCRERDLLHAFLAACLHMPYSPSLWDTAHGTDNDQEVHQMEEEMVLNAQAFVNLAKSYKFVEPELDND